LREYIAVLERALNLVCKQFIGDDDIAVQSFIRQAKATWTDEHKPHPVTDFEGGGHKGE